MNPAVVKYVHTFLGERLEEYEACYGEIPTNEVFEKRKQEYLQSKGPDDLESLKQKRNDRSHKYDLKHTMVRISAE